MLTEVPLVVDCVFICVYRGLEVVMPYGFIFGHLYYFSPRYMTRNMCPLYCKRFYSTSYQNCLTLQVNSGEESYTYILVSIRAVCKQQRKCAVFKLSRNRLCVILVHNVFSLFSGCYVGSLI